MTHPLLEPATRHLIEMAVSAEIGRSWRVISSTDLTERASHPALILHGAGYAVFAKLAGRSDGLDQLACELTGLRLIGERSGVAVPVPIGSGRVDLLDGSAVLLFEALEERIDRQPEDWRSIGHALALLHQVPGDAFGGLCDGYFGPLRQNNHPVESNQWADFYAVRRVHPWLRTAYDVGSIDSTTVGRVEALTERLPEFVGPEPLPSLLHGDAQHHNFVSTPSGAVIIDPAPYYGHPELDLALLDYFAPVPPDTWAAYQEVRPIDAAFAERRELWRIFAYLAILTVDGRSDFGRTVRTRLNAALGHYLG